MNTNILQNQITPRQGGLTLCMGEETGENIIASLAAAAALSRKPEHGPVLYINTIQTQRQLGNTMRSEVDPQFSTQAANPNLFFFTAPPGMLSSYRGRVENLMEELKPKTIIINSLDLSSKDYRRKEELLYTVMEWLGMYDAAIIIFAELRKRIPKQGKIYHGGGVGKFAAIAEAVEILQPKSELGETESSRTDSQSVIGEGTVIPKRTEVRSTEDNQGSSLDGLRVRPTGEQEESPLSGLRVRSTGVEEAPLNGLRVRPTGIIDDNAPADKAKHYPMSNRNRKLVIDYEKLHGKQQLPGESFRQTFERILGLIEAENGVKVHDAREMLNV